MTQDKDTAWPSIPSELYDAGYFLQGCEGHDDFCSGKISKRLLIALAKVEVLPGQQVLDVGCGRGEAVYWLAERGASAWGLDYAPPALELAQQQSKSHPTGERVRFMAANARILPFSDKSFDCVLLMDIVEHLYPWELHQALCETHRVLRPRGRLLVHTAPNRWYYRWGYPAFRLTERIRGHRLPTNPKQRFRYHSLMHVNEQSPWSLRLAMRRAGFAVNISVNASRTEWEQMGRVSRLVGIAATRLPFLKWVTCGDIFAVGHKD